VNARVEDLRYTRYRGPRRSHAAAVLALARWSALSGLGFRRGWRAKLFPFGLTLLAFAPAIAVLGFQALVPHQLSARFGDSLIPYRGYFAGISIIILTFAAVLAAELLCPDRRDRVLDLYYATALAPRAYLAAKLIGSLVPLLVVSTLPVVFLYLGNIVFAVHPLGYIERHGADPARILLAGFMISSYYALVGLAIASLARRRTFAIGALAGLMIISSATSGLLVGALGASNRFQLMAMPLIPIITTQRLFPEPFRPRSEVPPVSTAAWLIVYFAVVVVAGFVLLRRYRAEAT
jgi:ABC-2 type transport system permease protein